jgi:hypothetical protein
MSCALSEHSPSQFMKTAHNYWEGGQKYIRNGTKQPLVIPTQLLHSMAIHAVVYLFLQLYRTSQPGFIQLKYRRQLRDVNVRARRPGLEFGQGQERPDRLSGPPSRIYQGWKRWPAGSMRPAVRCLKCVYVGLGVCWVNELRLVISDAHSPQWRLSNDWHSPSKLTASIFNIITNWLWRTCKLIWAPTMFSLALPMWYLQKKNEFYIFIAFA